MGDIPYDVLNSFTYGGRVKIFDHYYDNIKKKVHTGIWTNELIEEYRSLFKRGKLQGNYRKFVVDEISRHIDDHMLEKVICN